MSVYFAKKCNSGFYRNTLAEIIGVSTIRDIESEGLVELIYNWLAAPDNTSPEISIITKLDNILSDFSHIQTITKKKCPHQPE